MAPTAKSASSKAPKAEKKVAAPKAAPKKPAPKKVVSPAMEESRNFKVLVAKCGLDGHDRGAKIIARSLRDAGFDVVYGGLHQTPEAVVDIALQEDVDVIGLSVLSGAHLTVFKKILDLLKKKKADNIQVIGGGIMMDDDIQKLKEMGVKELFTPGANTDDIVAFVRDLARKARQSA